MLVQSRRRWLSTMLPTVVAVSILFGTNLAIAISIENLEGDAGFRMASLKWSYPTHLKTPTLFHVKYCEVHTWGLHRCRYQTIDELTARTGRQDKTSQSDIMENNFIVDIGGLRMSTNYSFQVLPYQTEQTSEGLPSQISLRTKGFSAKTTKCLADTTEVVVETGPFFGGRISAEDSTSPGCYIKGDSQSPQTTYSLRIRHKECGSVVDGSKITSVIVVQENIPILTHSARRFIVVCSISPDSFIVKAGVTLPRETSVAKALDFNRIVRLPPRSHAHPRNIEIVSKQKPQAPNGQLQPQSQQKHSNSIQDASYVSHLYADPNPLGESRAFEDYRGGWETFIVLGMICAAIVASIGSVIWFIKSYSSVTAAHNDSLDAHSTMSCDGSIREDGDASSVSNVNPDEQEPNVEIDFEHSENVNIPIPKMMGVVTLNISPQNFSCA